MTSPRLSCRIPSATSALLFLVVAARGLGAANEPPDSPWPTVSVGGALSYAPADGFLQIPAGGQPGSSTGQRPTLKELGIHDAVFYDIDASVAWRHLTLDAGDQRIDLSGTSTLAQSLTSRNVVFPAATRVHGTADFNWLRFGAGWKFWVLHDRLELTPRAEFGVLDFRYKLSGGGTAVERTFPKGCVRLVLDARSRVTSFLTAGLRLGGSLPLSNSPLILRALGYVEARLLPERSRFQPHLLLGLGGEWIDYEDNQRLPNHYRLDLGPVITGGLRFAF